MRHSPLNAALALISQEDRLKEKCAMCLQVKKLCKSHAIPNSYFRAIFKSQENSQAILISDKPNKEIRLSQDSWATKQLCSSCEIRLNKNYEKYGIDLLNGKIGSFERKENGINVTGINTVKLRDYVISILWRASKSKHPNYSQVKLSDKLNESLRFALNTLTSPSKRLLSIRIFRLVDSTKDGFDRDMLRDAVSSPFMRDYELANVCGKSVCFVFHGFLFEIFPNGRPLNITYNHEFVGYSKDTYFFKYLEICDVPELFHVMLVAYGKNEQGLVSPKVLTKR